MLDSWQDSVAIRLRIAYGMRSMTLGSDHTLILLIAVNGKGAFLTCADFVCLLHFTPKKIHFAKQIVFTVFMM